MLAVALAAAMAVPAFAATPIDTDNATSATGKDAGDYTIGVDGTYVAGTAAEDVISVDISWDAMDFTYTANMEYDVGSHTNKPNGTGSWSTNKAGITVTNRSNVWVKTEFSFTASENTEITGSFYDSADSTTALTTPSFSLQSGEDTTTDGEGYTTPGDTIYFGVGGSAIDENSSLGLITVKISKETWETVTTFKDLNAALTGGKNVKLGNDIDAAGSTIVLTANAKLDLNGHSLTGYAKNMGDVLITVGGTTESTTIPGSLFVIDSVGGGKITNSNSGQNIGTAIGVAYSSKLTILGGELSANTVIHAVNNSEVVIAGGKLKAIDNSMNGILGLGISIDSGSTLNITGGEISATNDAISLKYCTAQISGGTVTGNLVVGGATLTITGGTFSFDPTSRVDTSNYTVTTNDDGTYTVTKNDN